MAINCPIWSPCEDDVNPKPSCVQKYQTNSLYHLEIPIILIYYKNAVALIAPLSNSNFQTQKELIDKIQPLENNF